MRRFLLVLAAVCSLSVPALPQAMKLNQKSFTRYQHVQTFAYVVATSVSSRVSVRVQLRNLGGMDTACLLKAGGQKRLAGISAYGEAEVNFDAITNFSGYTVQCWVS